MVASPRRWTSRAPDEVGGRRLFDVIARGPVHRGPARRRRAADVRPRRWASTGWPSAEGGRPDTVAEQPVRRHDARGGRRRIGWGGCRNQSRSFSIAASRYSWYAVTAFSDGRRARSAGRSAARGMRTPPASSGTTLRRWAQRVRDLPPQPVARLADAVQRTGLQQHEEMRPRLDLAQDRRLELAAAQAPDVHEDVEAVRHQVVAHEVRHRSRHVAAVRQEDRLVRIGHLAHSGGSTTNWRSERSG